MLAARIHGKEDVRIEDLDRPTPGPGEVLVRVRAATTCGTDLKIFLRGSHAKMIRLPARFGHEGAGEIAGMGLGVKSFKEGDRVVWNNSAPCGACFYCKKNMPSLCEDLIFLNGTYAEYVVIPERIVRLNLLPIPKNLSFDTAAMTEPFACVLHGADEIGIGKDDTVVVLGDGAIGLYFITACRLRGATTYLIGGSEERLALGKTLGAAGTLSRRAGRDPAAWICDETGREYGPDIVVEAVGQPTAWEESTRIVRSGGKVLLFGGCPRDTTATFSTERIHYDALTLKGVFHNTPKHVRESLEILSGPEGEKLSKLLAAPAPLADLPTALQKMRDRKALKVPIRP